MVELYIYVLVHSGIYRYSDTRTLGHSGHDRHRTHLLITYGAYYWALVASTEHYAHRLRTRSWHGGVVQVGTNTEDHRVASSVNISLHSTMGAVALCVTDRLCGIGKDEEGPSPPDRLMVPNPNPVLKASETTPATPTKPAKGSDEGEASAAKATPTTPETPTKRKSWLPGKEFYFIRVIPTYIQYPNEG